MSELVLYNTESHEIAFAIFYVTIGVVIESRDMYIFTLIDSNWIVLGCL